jgi:hypothetical protein
VKRGAWTRVLVLGLAAALALVLAMAAGHHHDSAAATHACAVCAALLDELPCPDGLPAVVQSARAHAYQLAVPLVRSRPYRFWWLTPPICGPPIVFLATPRSFPFVFIHR